MLNLKPHDPGVTAGWVHFPSGEDLVRGYLALPDGGGPAPLVVTAHENLGVTEHRQQVTRQLATEGFASLTVDMFSRIGGMPPQNYDGQEDRRAKAFLAARDEVVVPDLQAGLEFAAALDQVDGSRAGALGFCLGGGSVLVWATGSDDLSVVVSLYGIPVLPPAYSPTGSERSRIPLLAELRAPVQFHFGGSDEAIPPDQIDLLEAALPTSATEAELHRYEGAGHAYHDDTHPNHHPAAAALTWERTVTFLRERLS